MAVETLSNKLLFYFVLYSASTVNAMLSNTDISISAIPTV